MSDTVVIKPFLRLFVFYETNSFELLVIQVIKNQLNIKFKILLRFFYGLKKVNIFEA